MSGGEDKLALALKRELRRGERIVWQGKQIARVNSASFAIYFFAIPWTAFSIFWVAMASLGVSEIGKDGPGILAWAFPLFGLPFVLIGLGMMATPFTPLWQKGKVAFAVTNERIIRLQLGRRIAVKSVPARRIGMIERSEGRDSAGSLKIAIGVGADSDGKSNTEYFELGEVEDVLGAHDHIAAMARREATRAKDRQRSD